MSLERIRESDELGAYDGWLMRWREGAAPWLIATGVVALVFLLKVAIGQAIGEATPFLLFFSAILVTAVLAGFRGAAVASVLSAAGASYFLHWSGPPGTTALRIIIFLSEAGVVLALTRVAERAWAGRREAVARLRQEESDLWEAHQRLTTQLVNSPLAVAEWDSDFRCILWGGRAEQIFGWSEEEMLGKTVVDTGLVDADDLESVGGLMQQLLQGEPLPGPLVHRNRTKDGRELICEWYTSVLFTEEGKFGSILSLGHDTTARVKAEQELIDLARELEHRVEERTAELEGLNAELRVREEALERSNRELENFAYVASHDLQEPLRMVGSFTQLLSKRYGAKLGPEADEFIGFALEGVRRMQTLIQDLLTFSRVGRGDGEMARLELSEILGEAISALRLPIEEKAAKIEADPLPAVLGRRSAMVQLFQNLIGNSLKFSPERPVIRIRVEDADPAFWTLSFEDEGIGIEPRFADRVFAIFQRLHTRDEYEGTGIGLAICRKIVELHGGRIWIDPEYDRGARFRFTLPKGGTD